MSTALSVALRKESVDRNLNSIKRLAMSVVSLSARRAWIEISVRSHPGKPKAVALRKESVDRNFNLRRRKGKPPFVALRKESVDRNNDRVLPKHCFLVALRKESVDRNLKSPKKAS